MNEWKNKLINEQHKKFYVPIESYTKTDHQHQTFATSDICILRQLCLTGWHVLAYTEIGFEGAWESQILDIKKPFSLLIKGKVFKNYMEKHVNDIQVSEYYSEYHYFKQEIF